jgi:hypothetical protein
MRLFAFFFSLILLCGKMYAANAVYLRETISPSQMSEIAQKIWKNECGGKVEGLLSWNNGEDFASLGIGHFIWYSKDNEGPFKEVFPEFILFLRDKGIVLPDWLHKDKFCPWRSRSEFMQQQDSVQMNELRNLLIKTISLQADFMALRLQKSLPLILNNFSDKRRPEVEAKFNCLLQDPTGLYAVLDYLNFKGEGLLSTERYRGQGWGLVQVFEQMKFPAGGDRSVDNFAEAARIVLERRVANSPPERNEQRWLKGWLNRVSSYR